MRVLEAPAKGNTLRRPVCLHWAGRDPLDWLARQRTIALLGHERTGIPSEAVDLLDGTMEIPMIGTGASLNVAVADRSYSTGWPGSSESPFQFAH